MGRGDDAVSSVIGTVLMLGITVTVFSGVSLVVLSEVSENADELHADISILEGEEALLLRHGGGESIFLGSAYMLVNVEGVEQNVPLTQFTAETADPDNLAIGDSLCVSCLYPGQDVLGVVFVASGELLLAHGERGVSAGNVQPDLTVGAISLDPAAPWNGSVVTFETTVENIGLGSALASSVRFYVDDVQVATATVNPLAAGQTHTVNGTWPATPGNFTVRAAVDVAQLIAEEDEDNNEATLAMTVLSGTPDPGAPFEDVNGDGLFEANVDVLLSVATVADGAHDAGNAGLVIPPSIGALSAASWDIQGNGTHRIHVDLTATGGAISVAGSADLYVSADLVASGAVTASVTGAAHVNGTSWTAGNTLTLSAGTAAYADGTTLTSSGHRVYLLGAAVVAPGLVVDASSWAYVASTTSDLSMAGATVSSANDYAVVIAATDLSADDATVQAPELAYLGSSTGSMTAENLVLTATAASSTAFLQAPAGSITVTGLNADALGTVALDGRDGVTVQDADLDAASGAVTIAAEADIDIQGTTLHGDALSFDLGAANELFVQDACFLDPADDPTHASVSPSGVTITGTLACGTFPVNDPGFPFEDNNQDGAYTEGVDTPIDASEFEDGEYDAGANGLIIPASSDPITAPFIDFQAGGPSRIEVDLTATSGDIDIDIDDTLELDGTTLTTLTNNKDITVNHEGLSAVGTAFEARGHVTLTGGATDLTGATITTLVNNKDIEIASDAFTAPGLTIEARGHITIDADGDVDLSGSDLEALVNNKDIDIQATGDIDLQNAAVALRGHLDLAGDDIFLQDVDIDMLDNGKVLTIDATGWIHGDAGTNIEARGEVFLDADVIRMESVTITLLNNGDDMEWTASGGMIDMDGAQIEIRGAMDITATGDIWFRSGNLDMLVNNQDATFTGVDIHFENSNLSSQGDLVANTSGTVYGSASTVFDDDDDAMDVEPNGAHNNTPSGVWS